MVLGGTIITIFHLFKTDIVSQYEYIWTALSGIIACPIITLMGAGLVRISRMREKSRVKIAAALDATHAANPSRPQALR